MYFEVISPFLKIHNLVLFAKHLRTVNANSQITRKLPLLLNSHQIYKSFECNLSKCINKTDIKIPTHEISYCVQDVQGVFKLIEQTFGGDNMFKHKQCLYV